MRSFDKSRMESAKSPASTTQSIQLGVAAGLLAFASVAIPACGFDWDDYDPRLNSAVGGSGGAGMGGMGGSGVSSSSGSSSGGESGGAAGTGGMVDVCGKVDLLNENFNTPIDKDWLWDTFSDPTAAMSQPMGQLVFTKSGTMAQGGYGMIETTLAYDLRNKSISVEAVKVPTAPMNAQMAFALFYDDNNNVGLHYQDGSLKFGATQSGVFDEKSSLTYDPVAMRYWRLREANGAFFWDTAPDGQTWTTRGQFQTSSLIAEAVGSIRLDAYWPPNTIAPDEVRFDNLRGEASTTPHWCSASTLQDDFNDNSTSHVWERSRTELDCTYAEKNGQVVVHPSPTIDAYCGYRTDAAYDLTSSAVAVEIAQMVNTAANVDMNLEMNCRGGLLRITQNLGTLTSSYAIQGSPFEMGSSAYDGMKHHWWRIREADGTIYWEVSPDGKAWTEEGKTANPFDVSACDVFLYVETGNNVSMPGEARFDNLNRTP